MKKKRNKSSIKAGHLSPAFTYVLEKHKLIFFMNRIIEDFAGVKKETKCIGCSCAVEGKSVPGYILETNLFHAHQDQEVPIPGFVILSTKRHIQSVGEFTDDETREFADLMRRIRQAQREALGIENIYLIQEEDTEDHFHLWFLPRYEWMKNEEKFGRKVGSSRAVLQYAIENMKTTENIAKVKESAEKLREYLNK